MKLTIRTELFQSMVAKAVKGASLNGNLYITQLMAISLDQNVLTLITTDGNNFLYVREPKVVGDDFYAVVPIDKFSKLIAKQTCEEVVLEIPKSKKGELDKLTVKGNGRYTIELPYDENGELVEYEDPVADSDSSEFTETEINLSTIHLLLNTAKASLLVGQDASCYKGYYCGDRVVTTDSYKICGIEIQLFDEPKLIYPEFMDLLNTMSEEKISVLYNDDTLIFKTDRVTVYGKTMEGIENFKIKPISSLLDESYGSECSIPKLPLMQMLERLSLFVTELDDNSVYLTFTKDGLLVESKQGSGEEIIPYKSSNKFKDFTCCLDIDMFKAQVKAYQSDVIEIHYGKDSCIKLHCGNTTQLIALADDTREGEGE